jgi:putative hydrolase of the HAD superfamily
LTTTTAVRAVVFDYGMVLTGPPDPAAYDQLLAITGLTSAQLEKYYWADRHAYDEGKLTGLAFWEKILAEANLKLYPSAATELNLWDARMWTTQNRVMLNWQAELQSRGILTAILSNIGDSVLDNMKREFNWLSRFDVLVWSYQLRMAKPDAAIFQHVLKELGTAPEETLFIDDKLVNIEAANALGIRGILFTTADQLRADLIAQGLDASLPLPNKTI